MILVSVTRKTGLGSPPSFLFWTLSFFIRPLITYRPLWTGFFFPLDKLPFPHTPQPGSIFFFRFPPRGQITIKKGSAAIVYSSFSCSFYVSPTLTYFVV